MVLKKRASLSAVSVVMPRRSRTKALTREAGTQSFNEREWALMPIGLRNSSLRTSPGWTSVILLAKAPITLKEVNLI